MLTREQAIIASAAVVALAHERHVKTPEGVAYYHLPIGSLIIAHPDLKKLEHKRLVYAGGQSFAVPKDAKVWVQKLTDLHNDVEMAGAEKYITIGKPGQGRVMILNKDGNIIDVGGMTQITLNALQNTSKLVPEHELKVPLTKDAKFYGWMPGDWKAYESVKSQWGEHIIYARTPDGGWYAFMSNGDHTQLGVASEQLLNSMVTSGELAKYEPPQSMNAALHPPPHPETPPGPAPGKVTVGGIPVDKHELTKAIEILNNSNSTAVKQPLKHANHKLQHMDYTGVANKELATYPDLKIPAGTKAKHVGKVKNAVLHHMAGKLSALAADEAQHAQASKAKADTEAAAKEAQQATPNVVHIQGLAFGAFEIKDAIKALEGNKSTAIKQTLVKAGNPLAQLDYLKAANEHKEKSGHKELAKPAFIHALHIALGEANKADVESGFAAHQYQKAKSGHWEGGEYTNAPPTPAMKAASQMIGDGGWIQKPEWSALHETIQTSPSPEPEANGYYSSYLKAVGAALKEASNDGNDTFAWKDLTGNFTVGTLVPPSADNYYLVTPDHKALYYKQGEPVKPLSIDAVATLAKHMAEAGHQPVEPEKPPKKPKMMDVELNGEFKGKVPEGSVLYHHQSDKPGAYQYTKWIKMPNGDWTLTGNDMPGLKSTYQAGQSQANTFQASVDSGVLVPDAPVKKPPVLSEEVASKKLAKLLHDLEPSMGNWSADSGQTQDWNEALAAGLVSAQKDGGKTLYLHRATKSSWQADADGNLPFSLFIGASSQVDSWRIDSDGKVTFFPKTGDFGSVTGQTMSPQSVYETVKLWADVSKAKQQAGVGASGWSEPSVNVEPHQTPLPEVPKEGPAGWKVTVEPSASTNFNALMIDGKKVGEIGADQKVFKGDQGIYVGPANDLGDYKLWSKDGPHGLINAIVLKKTSQSAAAEQVYAPPEKEKTPFQKALEIVKNGAIPPGKSRAAEASGDIDYQYAKAAAAILHPSWGYGSSNFYFWKDAEGKWAGSDYSANYGVPEGGTVYHVWSTTQVKGSLKAEQWVQPPGHPSGSAVSESAKHPVEEKVLQDAINKFVVPNAALVGKSTYQGVQNPKLYKYGHYYKPKGKAHLEVGPGAEGYPSYGKTQFKYWNVAGASKDVTMAYAIKALANSTEFHETPKQFEPPKHAAHPHEKLYTTALNPNVAPVVGPNGQPLQAVDKPDYHMVTGAEHEPASLLVFKDGSGQYTIGETVESISKEAVDSLAETGMVLDKYGNTVMVPKAHVAEFHLFGAKMTPDELANTLSNWEQAAGNKDVLMSLSTVLKGQSGVNNTQAHNWLIDHVAAGDQDWNNQAVAITGLMRNMVHGVSKAAGGPTETTYIKTKVKGITAPKDIFELDDAGHAQPFSIQSFYGSTASASVKPFDYLTATELKEKIQLVSDKFGGGKVVGLHPASMNKDAKVAWLNAWTKGDMETAFNVEAASGKVSPMHPGAPKNPDTHHIDWAPFGKGEVPAGQEVEGDWTGTNLTMPLDEVHNYLIKAGMNYPTQLTNTEQRSWVTEHRQQNQLGVDALSKKAQDRHDNHEPPLSEAFTWTDNVKPAKSYDTYVEENTPAVSWFGSAVEDFVSDYGPELDPIAQNLGTSYGFDPNDATTWDYATSRNIIQLYLDDKKAKEEAERLKPVYSKTPGGASPVSSHPIYEIENQFGQHYFFKPADQKFLAEQEDMAAKIGNAWGFKTPESHLIEFDGHFGQAQVKLAAEGDMTYGHKLGFYDKAPVPWTELTDRQVSDIAKEHLLDWALGNDDGRASNFMLMGDGSIVGVDKGRAWAPGTLKWPGLSGDSSADERSAQMVTSLYQAIRDGKITHDTADKAYIDVVRRAEKMSRMSDEKYTGMLEQAFANRPGDNASMVKAYVKRKNSLEPDFQKLWGSVYKDAGWELPEVPKVMLTTRKGDTLHSGFSDPELLDHVNAAPVSGVPAFFGGADLEDNNALIWREYSGSGFGKPVMKGESATHGSAYKKLVDWCKANQTGTLGPHAPVQADAGSVKGEHDWYFNGIIEAAKTISYHNANGNTDYNASRLQKMDDAETNMKARLNIAEAALQAGPSSSLYAEFTTQYGSPELNQHAIKYYLDQVGLVNGGKGTGAIFQAGEIPQWEPPENLLKKEGPVAPKVQPKIKVILKQATREHGLMVNAGGVSTPLDDDGNFHAAPGNLNYSGQSWHIELPTGEEIVFSNGSQQGIELAHHGRIRFTAKYENGTASLENIRSQLQDMGLDLKDADDDDMQLFYWRHLAHVMADRKDWNNGKYGKVWQELATQVSATAPSSQGTAHSFLVKNFEDAGLDPDTELAMWHAAWAHVTSPEQVDHFVSERGYLPHMEHWDIKHPDVISGDPYWMRFDLKPADVLNKQMPQHSYTGDTIGGALLTMRAGGTLSKEEQIRRVGAALGGMDNPEDSGATNGVYLRQNMESSSGVSLLLNPMVAARTSTYAIDHDGYGRLSVRKVNSPFDFSAASVNYGSDNEMLVKNALSVLDSIEVIFAHGGESQRNEIIKQLHDAGIHELRGVPVEQRVVYTHAELAVIKAAMQKNMKDIDWGS